jgi:hypothetical protein
MNSSRAQSTLPFVEDADRFSVQSKSPPERGFDQYQGIAD